LITHGRAAGSPTPLLEAVLRTNAEQPGQVLRLLNRHWADLAGVRVAVLGLSFKPETSDVRESPAFPIMRELVQRGALVKAYDPIANEEAAKGFGNDAVQYCNSVDSALADIDAVIVVTPWRQFRDLPARLAGRDVVLVDGRRAYEPKSVGKYEGIGL
jgi:UDPglucose 6-dehydrogenase/GDP-mannose 6-dehydrogenase